MPPHENAPPDHLGPTFSGSVAKGYNSRTGGCNILLASHLISLIKPPLQPLPPPPPHLQQRLRPRLTHNPMPQEPDSNLSPTPPHLRCRHQRTFHLCQSRFNHRSSRMDLQRHGHRQHRDHERNGLKIPQ